MSENFLNEQFFIGSSYRPQFNSNPARVRIEGKTAVIDIFDYISKPVLFQIKKSISDSLADHYTKQIILNFDSHGGVFEGAIELSDFIFSTRKKVKIISIANSTALGTAYLLASSAEQVFMINSGQVGGIGLFWVHMDQSKQLAMDGINPKFIYAGKHKVEGNPFEPLRADGRRDIQQKVDKRYQSLINTIARNRGVSAYIVRHGFGQGRVVMNDEAVRGGMADKGNISEQSWRNAI